MTKKDQKETEKSKEVSIRIEVLDPGHNYLLQSMDGGPRKDQQTLQFIKKESFKKTFKNVLKHDKKLGVDKYEDVTKTVFETVVNGTTNEAVLEVLIDRMEFLNKKLPCTENAQVLGHLNSALDILEERTARRVAAKVEGTDKPDPKNAEEKAAKSDKNAQGKSEKKTTPAAKTKKPTENSEGKKEAQK